MEISRRTLIKGAGGITAAAAVGSATGTAQAAGTPPDYPAALPPPFSHGVASGDPLADRVILWTRLTVVDPAGRMSVPVDYEVARDPGMTERVTGGSVTTGPDRDWTVKVDPLLPDPATTYYYRFSALGATSSVGRTRTAPAGDVAEVRFAVVSCSSYWSGFFNAYGQIARRNDLDLVLHCGDHVYDFVDEDEWVRARDGRFDPEYVDFRDWRTIDEVRRRYALHYSDPDLLVLHQQRPISILWDNHDIDPRYEDTSGGRAPFAGPGTTRGQVLQVFWEWTPSRPPRGDGSGAFPARSEGQVTPEDTRLVYRSLPYGTMTDVFLVDTQSMRNREVTPPELLGERQFSWILGALEQSAARGTRWRTAVNGFPLGQLRFANAPASDTIPFPSELRESQEFYGAWDSFPQERQRLLSFLRAQGIGDNVVVTGDAHGSFGWDLVEDNTVPAYEPATGGGTLGSVGVEFLPSSVSRGGAEETFAGILYRQAFGGPPYEDRARYEPLLVPGAASSVALEQELMAGNPNLRYIQWRDHGYGIVHLTQKEAVLEYWWTPILAPSQSQTLGQQLRTARGANHLEPVVPAEPTSGSRVAEPAPPPGQGPPPVIPEVPVPAMLVVTGLAAGAVVAMRNRRRDVTPGEFPHA